MLTDTQLQQLKQTLSGTRMTLRQGLINVASFHDYTSPTDPTREQAATIHAALANINCVLCDRCRTWTGVDKRQWFCEPCSEEVQWLIPY